MQQPQQSPLEQQVSLTERQLDILRVVSRTNYVGSPRSHAAKALSFSERTIKGDFGDILAAFGCLDIFSAVCRAYDRSIIKFEDGNSLAEMVLPFTFREREIMNCFYDLAIKTGSASVKEAAAKLSVAPKKNAVKTLQDEKSNIYLSAGISNNAQFATLVYGVVVVSPRAHPKPF